MVQRPHRGALIAPGVLLGAGLGGFLDGIVLHQVLQWHHLLSSRVASTDLVGLKFNMVWDGVFHLFTWLMTVVGLGLLFRAGKKAEVPWSTPLFLGSLSLGWGLFNVIEGSVDHFALGLHHVHPGADQLLWDVAFVLVGALLVALGASLLRAGGPQTDARRVTLTSRPPVGSGSRPRPV